MQFLTDGESRAWAVRHGYQIGDAPLGPLADDAPFSVTRFLIPADAGRRVAIAKALWPALASQQPEVLIWVTTWGVWESGEHEPLVRAARAGLGESRSLFEAPGCLARMGEDGPAISMVCLAILFLWDCWLLQPNGQLAVFLSHDEFGGVCAIGGRDAQLARTLVALDILP
jgi:hypothetical protein